MNPNFLTSVRNSSVFGLICEGQYGEAAQVLEEQLHEHSDLATNFEACASVLLVSDQFDRVVSLIASLRDSILESKSASCLSAAILHHLERSEQAEIYWKRFEEFGGTRQELHEISAYVAQTSGEPSLHMEHLFKRAFLKDVDKDKALLKYLRVCLQYGDFDRAAAISPFLNNESRLGQYSQALLEALGDDRRALLDRIKKWLTDPNSDARYSGLIDSLWTEAGLLELHDSAKQAGQRWKDDPIAFARALRHHFVRLKGSAPNGFPEVQKLKVEESNFTLIALALIDHGYLDKALNLIDTLEPLQSKSVRSYGESLKKLITKIRSLHTRREIVVDRPDMDWLLTAPAEPGKLCVVFTGLNGQVGLGGIQILDRFLASFGYQVLYVRDFNRLAFSKGINSRGHDKEISIKAIKHFLEENGSQSPIIIGASRGAAAAIEYGLKLKARKILTFGYQGWRNDNNRWRIGDARAALFNARYNQRDVAQNDSLRAHMKNANHEYQIDMFHQRLNHVDAYHARSLQPSQRLKVHPLNGSRSHSCLITLILRDELKNYL